MKRTIFDVAVIGMGPAGLVASVSAAELGARVVVLDPRAKTDPKKQQSCVLNAVNPRELARMGLDDSPERFLRDSLAYGSNRADRDLLETLCYSSTSLLLWLLSLGVTIEGSPFYARNAQWPRSHRLATSGEGGLFHVLQSAARRLKVAIHAKNVTSVTVEAGHAILEVDGSETLVARTVVFATGGFAACRNILRAVDPVLARLPVSGQAANQTGFGFKALQEMGAAYTGLGFCQVETTTPHAAEALRRPADFILINEKAERFIAEDSFPVTLKRAIAKQQKVWAILTIDDNVGRNSKNWLLEAPQTRHAQTLHELAETCCLPSDALQATVRLYRNACNGTNNPNANTRDILGKTTANLKDFFVGSTLVALPIELHLTATLGGIRINRQAAVLNWAGAVLPGVYAAGDLTGGLHGVQAIPGNRLLGALVFGRLAGQNAARESRQKEEV